jgi:16S rRNA A1518/A1519 N6-dimethyltransferase RsmA/KsgA/DIM1 with predicted DNA glycosylase/AP lyase activity
LTALEIDPRLAGALKQRLRGTNVRVIEDDATKTPFEDRSFSAVISLTMLHHVPSSALQDKLLRKPGVSCVMAGYSSASTVPQTSASD